MSLRGTVLHRILVLTSAQQLNRPITCTMHCDRPDGVHSLIILRCALTCVLREQEAVPKKLIVIGSGYIGLEFSCIFDNLGTEVHIMFRQDKPLRGFDEEVRV